MELTPGRLKINVFAFFFQSVSDYASASANLPSETKGLPLASLSYLTPISAPKIQNVAQDLRLAASVTHCQDQVRFHKKFKNRCCELTLTNDII